MKFIANDYTPAEVMRIIREWSELSQKDFAKTVHRSEKTIQAYELGTRNFNFQTLMDIAKTHNLKITIEKKMK